MRDFIKKSIRRELGDKEDARFATMMGVYPPFIDLMVKIDTDFGRDSDLYKALLEYFVGGGKKLIGVEHILKAYDVYDNYQHFLHMNEQEIDGQNMNAGTETVCNKMSVATYAEGIKLITAAIGTPEQNPNMWKRISKPLSFWKQANNQINGEVRTDGMSGDSMVDESNTWWAAIQSTICEQGNDGLTEAAKVKEPILNDNFYKWFDGSKVVDSNGQPLVCYHGTSKKFSKFMRKYSAQGVFWFTSDKDKIVRGEAGAASTNEIIPVFISAKSLAGWEEYEKLGLGQIRDRGFQAIKLDDDYVVFDPTHIKSIYNKGEWDPTNKNIFK